MAAFPTDWGREQLASLEFIDHAEDLVLHGDVGCGKTHLAIAIGTLACRRGIPVRFFTASGLIMRLRKAKTDNRLDQELKTIGKADLLIIARARLPAHRHRRRQAPVPGSSPTATVRRSIILRLEPGSGRWGDVFGDGDMAAAVIDRIDPPRTHHPIPRRILPKHPLTHEITNKQRKPTNRPYRPT